MNKTTPFLLIRKIIIVVVLNIFLFQYLFAQKVDINKSTRQTLTGNWYGIRDSLINNGITIKPRITFFYQGTNVDHAEFCGKADMKVILNGVKIGIPKWTLITQLEQNFGKTINGSGGLAMPQNMAIYQPVGFDISNLYLLYSPIKSTSIMFGKINMVEIAAGSRFMGGGGVVGVTNPVFVAAPSGIIPPYILGSIVSLKTKKLKYTLMIFDPESMVNKTGFETTPFKDVNISTGVELPIVIGGLPGAHALKAVFSTKDGADLYHLNDINLPVQDSVAPVKTNRYYFSYSFNQYFVKYSKDESGWGIFGQVSISDGNPNAIYTSLYCGFGGNSFIKKRKQDRWGLGYFSYGLSKGLIDYAATYNMYLGYESCYTFFYTANFNKWFSLGVDFQSGQSTVKSYSRVYTLGVRTRILL